MQFNNNVGNDQHNGGNTNETYRVQYAGAEDINYQQYDDSVSEDAAQETSIWDTVLDGDDGDEYLYAAEDGSSAAEDFAPDYDEDDAEEAAEDFAQIDEEYDGDIPVDGSSAAEDFAQIDEEYDGDIPADGSSAAEDFAQIDEEYDGDIPVDGSSAAEDFALIDEEYDGDIPVDGSSAAEDFALADDEDEPHDADEYDAEFDEDSYDADETDDDLSFLNASGNISIMNAQDADGAFKFKEVAIADILAPKENRIRKEVWLQSMVQSIRETGLLEPLVVAPLTTKGKYVLLSGYRRLMACAVLGKKVVPCVINTRVKTVEIPIVEALYNHAKMYSLKEKSIYVKYLVDVLGMTNITNIEYLAMFEAGDYSKLNDIESDGDPDILDKLEKTQSISDAFKALEKRRAKESKEDKENRAAGEAYAKKEGSVATTLGVSGDTGFSGAPMSDAEIKQAIAMPSEEDVQSKDLHDLVEEGKKMEGFEPEVQSTSARHTLDPALRKAVMARYKNQCQCCHEEGPYYVDVNEAHHVLPVFLGGADDAENLVCLCVKCHKMVHLWSEGKLFVPDIDGLDTEEQAKLKRIIAYGNVIRNGMSKSGPARKSKPAAKK